MYFFYSGDLIFTKQDGLVHLIGYHVRSRQQWATVCRRFDDWSFRTNVMRGEAMRTTGPVTCLDCIAGR